LGAGDRFHRTVPPYSAITSITVGRFGFDARTVSQRGQAAVPSEPPSRKAGVVEATPARGIRWAAFVLTTP
jgi:hypothetical protein